MCARVFGCVTRALVTPLLRWLAITRSAQSKQIYVSTGVQHSVLLLAISLTLRLPANYSTELRPEMCFSTLH